MPQAELVKDRNENQVLVEASWSPVSQLALPPNLANPSEQTGDDAGLPGPKEQIDGFMAHLLQCLGNDTFSLWFGPQTSVRLTASEVCIEAASDFLLDCIKNFCQPELNNSIRCCFGADFRLKLAVAGSQQLSPETSPQSLPSKSVSHVYNSTANRLPAVGKPPVKLPSQTQRPSEASTQVAKSSPTKAASEPSLVKSGHAQAPSNASPKNVPPFFVSKSNRLAATAADMIVDKPGEIGLLFVYGPNGVGKTHLCKSIRERLKVRHNLRRVMYMTAEQFTIDFSESTRGAGFAAFRKKYRDVEGLIIDDAQFFFGKQQTLAELRNTVDDLLGRRRQVVMTADRPLSELVSLGNDLHARLSGGVTCCLESLDVSLRRSLLEDICLRHQVDVTSATLDALAERATGDGRSLYGLVFRLLTQQRVAGQRLSHEQAMACTHDLLQANQAVVRLPDIERIVCDSFGLEPKALRAKTRGKNATAARMLAMFLARKHTSAAFSEIGEYFGNRQHSTVISAQKRVEVWLTSDEPLNHRAGTISIRDWIRNAESILRVG